MEKRTGLTTLILQRKSGAMQPHIVGIRFQKLGKTYHFDASRDADLSLGDFAVVHTRRGRQLGQVVQVLGESDLSKEGSWKPIERKATPRDLVLRQTWHKKETKATIDCRAAAAELNIRDVKFVASEYSFDGKNLTILYSFEGDGKPDLSKLLRRLRKQHKGTKVEMRLIGPRDVAKILGGMGACGLETRCCAKFLTEFSPISIKMAKSQGVSLNPAEITGMCGRLRCCLIYEYEAYVKARKELPKMNKRVVTPLGTGRVVNIMPLKEAVIVDVPDHGRMEFLKHELEPWDELEALRRKSQEPCDRHENGGCDCGRAEKKTE